MENGRKLANSTMNALRRKKLDPKRPDMHHRCDAAQVCGGFWWVSQGSTAPYLLPEGKEAAQPQVGFTVEKVCNFEKFCAIGHGTAPAARGRIMAMKLTIEPRPKQRAKGR